MSRTALWWILPLVLCSCATATLPTLQAERATMARHMDAGASPAAHRDYGWTLLSLGEGAAGQKELLAARAGGLADARTLLLLALRAHDTSQVGEARELWTTILERFDPRDPWAPAIAELAAHRLLSVGTEAPGKREEERAYAQRVFHLWQRSQGAVEGTLPPEALQLLGALLGQLLRLQGREAEAQKVDEQRGCPASFYVTGPHGHLPRLDLSTSFPPDDPGRDPGRKDYRRLTTHGCELLLDGAQGRPGVMYGITWVQVPASGALPLTLETNGDLFALYVDGKLRYREEDPIRRRHLWLDLSAGWHALALKVSVPDGRAQVQLALPGAHFHEGPMGDAPPVAVAAATPALRRPLSQVPAPRRGHEQVLRSLLLAQQAYVSGMTDAGVAQSERGLSQAPRFTTLWLLQAGLLAEDTSRPQRIVRDRVRRVLRRALDLDGTLWRARLNLVNMELQDDHAEQALMLLDDTPRGQDPGWEALLMRYRVIKARGWVFEAEQVLLRARSLGPAACSPLESVADLHREQKDERGALQAARELSTCNPYSERYAEELRSGRDFIGAEKEYRRLLLLDPESESLQQSLAEVLIAQGGKEALQKARELLRRLIGRYPRSAFYRVKLANVLVELSEPKQAEAALSAGLRFTPESQELHRALLALGMPSVMDPYRVDGQKVVREYAKGPAAEHLQDAAVIVLDRTVTRVFPTGARLTLTHNIIRVQSKEGIDQFGEVQIPEGADVLTLRTIKADGTTREPEEISEKETVSAPDLEAGDYVEFEYVDKSPAPPSFPGGFLTERFFFASNDAPLDRTEYVLVSPWDMPLQIDRRGPALPGASGGLDAPEGKVERRGDDRVSTWGRRHVPRVFPEPPQAEGLQAEWTPSVRVGSGLSFTGWRDFLRDRLYETLRPNQELQQLAALLAGPPPAPGTDLAPAMMLSRTRKLDAWVRRNIKQSGGIDEQATAVLARREGNRNVLLSALLLAAGVPSEIWLVRPMTAPMLPGDLPEVEAYNEPVLAVGPGLGDRGAPLLFLDPQYRHTPSGLVRPALRGGRALRVGAPQQKGPGEASFALVDLQSDGSTTSAGTGAGPGGQRGPGPLPTVDHRTVVMKLALLKDGSGEVTVEETLSGWPALEWREQLEHMSDDQVRKELEQRSLGFFFPGATLLDLRYGPIDDGDDSVPLKVSYRFSGPQLGRLRRGNQAGDEGESKHAELVLPAPYPSLLSKRYVGVPSRHTPLLLQYVVPTDLDEEVTLPPGAGDPVLAPPLSLSDFGRFVQRTELSKNRLHLHAEFAMPLRRVEPARYPDFVHFAARVDAAESAVALVPVK